HGARVRLLAALHRALRLHRRADAAGGAGVHPDAVPPLDVPLGLHLPAPLAPVAAALPRPDLPGDALHRDHARRGAARRGPARALAIVPRARGDLGRSHRRERVALPEDVARVSWSIMPTGPDR